MIIPILRPCLEDIESVADCWGQSIVGDLKMADWLLMSMLANFSGQVKKLAAEKA